MCHQLAADTQTSTAAATMTAAVRRADHYTPSAERTVPRKQKDSYLSSQIESEDECYLRDAEVMIVNKKEMAREKEEVHIH